MMSTPSVQAGGSASFMTTQANPPETAEPAGMGVSRPAAQPVVNGQALGDRKAQAVSTEQAVALWQPSAAVTAALDQFTVRITASIHSREFKNAGYPLPVIMPRTTLFHAAEVLFKAGSEMRSQDWVTPVLKASVHLIHHERGMVLALVMRAALSSDLTPAQRRTTLETVVRHLERADAPAQRAAFAGMAQVGSLANRDADTALAMLEAGRAMSGGLCYTDAAQLVNAALRDEPQRPGAKLEAVVPAVLGLLNRSNQTRADEEPLLELAQALGQGLRRAPTTQPLETMLSALEPLALRLRSEQLGEFVTGCVSGMGGVKLGATQRDAWIAFARRMAPCLRSRAMQALWSGLARGLLVLGGPGQGFAGAFELPLMRSEHMQALLAVALEPGRVPPVAGRIVQALAGSLNKVSTGPGTFDELLVLLVRRQGELPASTGFAFGCALAEACSVGGPPLRRWEAVVQGEQLAKESKAQAVPSDPKTSGLPMKPIAEGWRFVRNPAGRLAGALWPEQEAAEAAVVAWSLPGVALAARQAGYLKWLADSAFTPQLRCHLLERLLEATQGAAIRSQFAAVRELLLRAISDMAEAQRPDDGPQAGLRPAIDQLMLAYDRHLAGPPRLDDDATTREYIAMAMRDDVLPQVYDLVLERLTTHARETRTR